MATPTATTAMAAATTATHAEASIPADSVTLVISMAPDRTPTPGLNHPRLGGSCYGACGGA